MKLKEIDRTANVAWSPVEVDPIYLALGTAAQQLDSSFSTNSTLEIYQFDVNQSGLDLPVKATLPCESRFHKLIWGNQGITENKEHPQGLIIGGCDSGVMQVYDASKILNNESPLVLTKSKHTGAVRALDFNPFRSNLVASGASESEIFIWDLTNPKTPMTPGTKVQPADDVSHLAWNKQVEHILASTFSTRCVVWDLRKNEPVIKVSDTTSRIRYKVVEWHPEVATQMCLASEDDNSPVIQLWDLRYATAPLKVIHGHQRGILGMAWCPQDPDLLITCGKDARILCWNPNYPHPGYEMLCDIPTSTQFSFDVSFCPKNPIVIASSSYDGRVSIFGLSGGVQHPITSSKLADSFPGMDLSMGQTPLPSQQPALLQLRDAPKWLKRPCGASFAFGGKLISFSNIKSAPAQQGQAPTVSGVVNISQLITLPNLIERSKKLEQTLQSGSLESYCATKALESGETNEGRIWEFLQANFSQNPRQAYLSMLGFNTAEILEKLNNTVNALADGFEALGRGAPDGYANGYDFASSAPDKEHESEIKLLVPINDSSVDGKINQALLCGDIELAVNICLEDERWADALLLATKGSPELQMKAQNKYFLKRQNESTQMIRAIVTHDLGKLVERSDMDSWKQVLGILITYADQQEFSVLVDMLGQRLQTSKLEKQKLGALLCCICSGNLDHLVDVWVGEGDKNADESPDELQDLVEQVMILRKAGEHWGRESDIGSGALASKLVEYASLLASQGCLETALNFLGDSNEPAITSLRERLCYSLRIARPIKSQINPRSRQTSESARGLQKRPSYPTSSIKRGSSDFLNSTDFSNLTGPVHPPAAVPFGSNTGSYGNVYVNSNVPNTVGQFTPPGGPPSYGSGSSTGFSARPPSTTPAIYNPVDAPIHTTMATEHPVSTRTPLGSSLPQPPVSSAAHGWNDPPPIKSSNKAKAPVSSGLQGVNYPIFTPEPVSTRPTIGPYGTSMYTGQSNPAVQSSLPAPPMNPSQASYNSSYGQSMQSSYGQPQQSNFGPPPAQSNFGPPPMQNNSFGAPPPTQSSFGAPPPMQNNSFGAPPPTQSNFGAPPPTQNNTFGAPPPTQSNFGPPPTQNNSFGAPPPTQSNFGAPPPTQNNSFGAPPPMQSSFGVPPSTQNNSFGAPPPTQSSFGVPPPTQNNSFGGPSSFANSPPQSSFGPPSSQSSFVSSSQSSFAPTSSQSQFGPPPTTNSVGPPPPPTMKSALGPTPPPSTSMPFGAPGTQSHLPPTQNFAPTPSPNIFAPPPLNNSGPVGLPPTGPVTSMYTPTPPPSAPSPALSGGYPSLAPTATPPPFTPNPASVFQPINPASVPPAPQSVRPSLGKPVEPVEPPKPKGPIPEKHVTLIDTLEKLRSECYEVAHLHQMKRKLEDVARKLDIFSDKLRSESLSESTLNSLHTLVDAIKAHDYQQAVQIHTQLVTAGNFAEISTFLPAIKVLIQSATQLGV